MIRRVALTALFTVVMGGSAAAHPGWGLVQDAARQRVYYTDLRNVWSIERTGERRIAVANVHTHELMLDADGNLFGEDLQGTGNGWRYRVWRLSADGRLEDVIPWRSGFRDDYGFVQDTAGVLYWASCVEATRPCVVKQRARDGRVTVAANGATFERPLNFLAADPVGGVLVADGPDLKRLSPSGAASVAKGLSTAGGRFALMGFQVSTDGAVYLAAFEDRAVVRLDRDGGRRVVARTEAPWQPTAALGGQDGLWILEYDAARARVRHIDASGRVRVFGN